ncbi:MAG TPA: choice-of-anchor tandem repeat GloVer-containing protein [Tepidisphaeraceae bacterium]
MLPVRFDAFGGLTAAARRFRSSFPHFAFVGPGRVPVERLEPRRLLSGGFTNEQLASFAAGGSAGTAPAGQIAINSGNLYGFTTTGGANGTGAAYEVQPGDATPILLASFPAAASGGPSFVATGPVVDASGDVFGVTTSGGDAAQDGTVFEIARGSGALTTLATFDAATTGSSPGGTLIADAAGNLFGTTANGGANGCGTVWELAKGSSSIVTLAAFSPVSVNGASQNPGANGIAMDSGGDLFGTTAGNPATGSFGTVWELPSGTGTLQMIAAFNGTNGMEPTGAVAVDGNGNVFGVTALGGDNIGSAGAAQGSGTVWELPAGTGQIADLADFDSLSVGEFPVGGVLLDHNGNLFGTTSSGGDVTASSATGDGTVWEIPARTVHPNTIAMFDGTNGANPRGGLAVDGFGNVYGTTSAGGAGGSGAVFEMDLGGTSSSPAALNASVARTTLPASIAGGTSAHGTATVDLSNPSSTAVRGVFTINVYASSDGTIDAAATKIGSISRTMQVARNGTDVLTVPVASFPTGSTGTYSVLAQVTDAAGDTSNASTGPTVTVAQPFVALAESFTGVTVPTALVSGGKTRGQATLKVTNGGNVTASGPVQFTLTLSPQSGGAGTTIASVTRRLAIPAGRSVLVSIPVSTVPGALDGTYTLAAQVTDPTGGMSSAAWSTPLVVSPPTVMLAAAVDAFKPTSLAAGATSLRGTVTLTVTNHGNIAVGGASAADGFDFNLSLLNSDGTTAAELGSIARGLSLQPGQSRTLTLAFKQLALTPLVAGSYFPAVTVTVAGTPYSASATSDQPVFVS